MTATAKLYPSFLEKVLTSDNYNFSTAGETYSLSCKVALYDQGISTVMGEVVSIIYDANDTKTSDLKYVTTPASFLAGSTPEGSWTSYKDTTLYFQKTGADIKFWLEEVIWDDIPDGEQFNRIFVWNEIAIPGSGGGPSIIENHLIMYIGLSSIHTVDGAFKLRKTSGGEVKITFS